MANEVVSPEPRQILTTSDVADLFHVDTRTVAKWVRAGKLSCFRTPGNHIRFHRADVDALRDVEPRSA